MPIYEYRCGCGKEKEVLRSFAECDQPQICVCGKVMLRRMSVPLPAIFTPTGKGMALDTLNSNQLPNRRWKHHAEQLATAGLD